MCPENWDVIDAAVVCRQLGFPTVIAAPVGAHFGNTSGSGVMRNVQCDGSESTLLQCIHETVDDIHNCLETDGAAEAICEINGIV